MRPKQLERLMCEHVLIRDGHYPSSRTISEYFKVSSRTAHRDINFLRSVFGAPVDYDHTRHGFYYTKVGWNISIIDDSKVNLLLGFPVNGDISPLRK